MSEPIWAEGATDDLTRHIEWLDSHDAAAAARIRTMIIERARWLADLPLAGASVGRGRARSFRVLGTSYTLVYRPVGDTVFILRVRHAAEDWR